MTRSINRYSLVLSALALLSCIHASVPAGKSTVAPTAVTGNKSEGGNSLMDGATFIKEQLAKTALATQNSFLAFCRCNEIRSKQRSYRDSLRNKWQALGMDSKEISQRLKTITGGISYDEFVFLQRGKEDRERLAKLVICSIVGPNYFPYMLVYLPNTLPSHFERPEAIGGETVLETMSRHRSHAVLNALLSIENGACTVVGESLLNPFAKGQAFAAQSARTILAKTIDLMTSGESIGPEKIMECVDSEMYRPEVPKNRPPLLASISTPLIKSLGLAISGRPAFYDGVLPGFIIRANIINHLENVIAADNFLVNQRIDINALSSRNIVDACNARLIGTLGRSEEEMKRQLNVWLEHSTIVPNKRVQLTGEDFNGHFARSALMGYFALEATRDPRSSPVLPRLLFTSSSFSPDVHLSE